MADGWLVMAVGDDRQHGGNDGYLDDPSRSYSWDDTVANHGELRRGDPIVLWDKHQLLGVSVIDEITERQGTKLLYRCRHCGSARIKPRKTKTPRYRCHECSRNFEEPNVIQRRIRTYESRHEAGWVELAGVLDGAELRSLCESPRSQLSLRPLRWKDFREALRRTGAPLSLGVTDHRVGRHTGGHTEATVRVRRGQGAFRKSLIRQYGEVCALSGPAPGAALEAAHLYSYARVGRHIARGGLLLRRDLHTLFDTGRIAVEPHSLEIDVAPELAQYQLYASLSASSLAVRIGRDEQAWLAEHWTQHRRTKSR